MKFNPEDGLDMGPHCRNCHRGSSACNACHNSGGVSALAATPPTSGEWTQNPTNPADSLDQNGKGGFTLLAVAAANNSARATYYGPVTSGYSGPSTYNPYATSTQYNGVDAFTANTNIGGFLKTSRTATWDPNLRSSETTASAACSDDGFSWPHRTLGWKMLKDDLFGLDLDGTVVGPNVARKPIGALGAGSLNASNAMLQAVAGKVTHDIDSVCLDCHNPTVWNASSSTDHVDSPTDATDNNDDELLTRGLP